MAEVTALQVVAHDFAVVVQNSFVVLRKLSRLPRTHFFGTGNNPSHQTGH